ncbi:MAG: glycogen debranching protein GlgX [Caulobacterales bacterium]|nr:glycogen debranching protein GlgX [Caulobacterales bacterium]
MTFELIPGEAGLLGATPQADGVNFALIAPNAERVELCLFSGDGRRELARLDMPDRTDQVWTGFAPGAAPGLAYGYRVHGPYAPERGHRFNPCKLVLDPYARALAGDFRWGPEHYGYQLETGRPHDTFDERDNAATAWKGLVTDPDATAPPRPGPATPWDRTLICELHVRGFTMRHPDLPETERGRLSGLAAPAALDYLRALGVTALELLPIHAFLDDHRLVEAGLRNFWGYNTLSYFAIHPAYAGADPIGEMRAFVDAAHDAGLEVLLDVVYNHTCEGSSRGPTLSFRGIDNALYYRLREDDRREYADVSGCGSTLDAYEPAVRRLILDSLAYYRRAFAVDGFRFDIAPSLGIAPDGAFHPSAPFFAELAGRSELHGAKLIAEAWDAAGGFQVGNFPHGWAEWNAKARDAIKRFWRGDLGLAGEFAKRFSGSADLYLETGRPLWSSVNYAACHDDFPLADFTRYARKHNEANGEDNRDGPGDSYGANYGIEGPTDDPAINAIRARQTRNLATSALLAFGAPMWLAGDEFARTQGGNNNAYAQDNETSWVDWSLLTTPEGAALHRFVTRLTALRASAPAYRGDHFPAPRGHDEYTTIRWISPRGDDMREDDWRAGASGAFAACIEAPSTGASPPGALLIVFNPSQAAQQLRLPATAAGRWLHVLDTVEPDRDPGALILEEGAVFETPERATFIFTDRPDAAAEGA